MTNQEAIKYIENHGYISDDVKDMAIKALEKQKDNRWIPCSERLPEESLNSVIGWDEYRKRCVFVQYVQGKFQNMGTDDSFNITAWQPLPEPYKESEKE